jgi:hypothetical protein
MLLNDTKGSYGMYSRAGKEAAEKYNILMRKDEILSGNTKKMIITNLFNTDELKVNLNAFN